MDRYKNMETYWDTLCCLVRWGCNQCILNILGGACDHMISTGYHNLCGDGAGPRPSSETDLTCFPFLSPFKETVRFYPGPVHLSKLNEIHFLHWAWAASHKGKNCPAPWLVAMETAVAACCWLYDGTLDGLLYPVVFCICDKIHFSKLLLCNFLMGTYSA